jgi:hypothetical protein
VFLVRELRKLANVIEALEPGPAKVAFILFQTTKGNLAMGEITVVDTEPNLVGTIGWVDAEGNATTVESAEVTSSDEAVAVATLDADNATVTFEVGAPGVTLIEAIGTNADGTQTSPVQGTITVQPGDAAIGSIEFSTAPAA